MARGRSLPRQRDETLPQRLPVPLPLVTLWMHRGMEGLWLLAAMLIPLAYLNQDYVLAEAVIGYVELPKVALLRTLAALMAMLWAVEWAISGGSSSVADFFRATAGAPAREPLRRLRAWLKDSPTRWVTLAVWFFLITTLITTTLSASFQVSLWGEVPGQDGYPTYTVLAYILIFGAVATHLKTRAQLWRLLGAIVVMGALITAYSVFQHYGHDFLTLNEDTGGSPSRSTSTTGNALFAAAVMMMVIPISLAVATIAFRVPDSVPDSLRRNLISHLAALVPAAGLALVLATQILGITFTFSRGPWLSTILAVVVITALTAIFVGWRTFMRVVALIGLTGGFGLAMLQWLGSVSILGLGPWVGALLVIGGLVGMAITFFNWNRLSRIAMVAALSVVLVAAVIFGPSRFGGGDSPNGTSADSGEGIGSQVAEKFSSIQGQVLSGALGGRADHWSASWELIKDRPWFSFDDLSLPWLRPVIGYGPDLFRFTYLLESTPDGPGFEPLEPDHAHNYFIHQAVEQGLLGFLSSVGILAAVFIVGGYQIIKHRKTYSIAHKVLLIALVSTIVGRFFEMQTGVAKVSDLTILWILLAIFVALPSVMKEPHPAPASKPNPTPSRPRNASGASAVAQTFGWSQLWRLAVVAWLIGGLGILTWQKGINPPRAAAQVRVAANEIGRGDFQAALGSLDRAIDLAPDVAVYRIHKASVYRGFLINVDRVAPERECSSQSELRYDVCLAGKDKSNNQKAVNTSPFNYRPRIALGNSALNLFQHELAIRYFRESVSMIPASYLLRNELASAYIEAGRPREAFEPVEVSLAITRDTRLSVNALYLRGLAYFSLGEIDKAVQSLEASLELNLSEVKSERAYQILDEYYAAQDNRLTLASLDRIISREPSATQAWQAYLRRAEIHYVLGDLEAAIIDYYLAAPWGPDNTETYMRLGAINAELGRFDDATRDYTQAISLGAEPASAYLARGRALAMVPEYQNALEDIAQALRLDPGLIPAYISKAQVYAALGQFEEALAVYGQALALEPEHPNLYAGRGSLYPEHPKLYAGRGSLYIDEEEFNLAIQDLNQAVQLAQDACAGPGCAEVLYKAIYLRGRALFELGLYEQSVQEMDQAIRQNSQSAEAHLLRGDAYLALGQEDLALGDHERAAQLSIE